MHVRGEICRVALLLIFQWLFSGLTLFERMRYLITFSLFFDIFDVLSSYSWQLYIYIYIYIILLTKTNKHKLSVTKTNVAMHLDNR